MCASGGFAFVESQPCIGHSYKLCTFDYSILFVILNDHVVDVEMTGVDLTGTVYHVLANLSANKLVLPSSNSIRPHYKVLNCFVIVDLTITEISF